MDKEGEMRKRAEKIHAELFAIGLRLKDDSDPNKMREAWLAEIETELTAATKEEREKWESVVRKYLDAEDIEYLVETRTCPQATLAEINEARDQRKAARDALAALTEEME